MGMQPALPQIFLGSAKSDAGFEFHRGLRVLCLHGQGVMLPFSFGAPFSQHRPAAARLVPGISSLPPLLPPQPFTLK